MTNTILEKHERQLIIRKFAFHFHSQSIKGKVNKNDVDCVKSVSFIIIMHKAMKVCRPQIFTASIKQSKANIVQLCNKFPANRRTSFNIFSNR